MPIIIGVTAAGKKMAGLRVTWKVVNFLANFLPAVHFIKSGRKEGLKIFSSL